MIVRLIIIFLFFYLVFRVIRYVMGQGAILPGPGPGGPLGEIDNIMIQDPYCHIYFQKKEGVHLRHKGKDLYFCSVECRNKYLDSLPS
jgi:YHS domain-containing protein